MKDHTFRLLSWNAHSLDGLKAFAVNTLMKEGIIDFAGVSETWKTIKEGYYEGMRSYGLDTVANRRGLAWFDANRDKEDDSDLPTALILKEYSFQTEQLCVITWQIGDMMVLYVYLPNGNSRLGMDLLRELIQKLKVMNPLITVMGDLNAKLDCIGDGYNAAGRALAEMIDDGVIQRIPLNHTTFLTSGSCLDHVLTTCTDRILDYGVTSDSYESDHLPIWVQISVESTSDMKLCDKAPMVTSWRQVAQFMEKMLPDFDEKQNFVEQVDTFVRLVNIGKDKYSRPRGDNSTKSMVRIHVDKELKSLFRQRNSARGELKKRLSKTIRRLIRRRKRKAWAEFVHRGASAKKSKSLWQMFRKSRGSSHGSKIDVDSDPEKAREIAELFEAAHYIKPSIRANLDDTVPDIAVFDGQLFIEETNCEEIECILKRLPRKGSAGVDNIPYLLFREAGDRMTQWITDCVNASLKCGAMGTCWKQALIRPLAKPSGGYRPISLISNMAKVVERVLCRRLMKYLKENNLLPQNQYAIQGGTSAALNGLLDFVNTSPYPCYLVFFDVKKAFDRVHVPTLLRKLEQIGIPDYIIRWIANFVLDRTCRLGASQYEMAEGIPQGSVLSPILFMLYTSEILNGFRDAYCAAYADDLVIGYQSRNPLLTPNRLQRILTDFYKRTLELGIELDARKTKMMIARSERARKSTAKKYRLHLGDSNLDYCTKYKYLGVILDSRMSFSGWITRKLKEAAKRESFVFRLRSLTRKPLRALWKGYVFSYFIYGLPEVWHLLKETQKRRLLHFYGMSAKRLAGLPWQANKDEALPYAGLHSLEKVIEHRRAPIPEGRARKPRLSTPELTVDLPSSIDGRHIEITFTRWRSGCLLSNVFKHQHHFGPGPLCRFCKLADETRMHILFDCTSIDRVVREKFLAQVVDIYQIHRAELCLGHILGLGQLKVNNSQLFRLAALLTEYLDSIRYFA